MQQQGACSVLQRFVGCQLLASTAGSALAATPPQVNYYSQKQQAATAPLTGTVTRLRYKWTTKKAFAPVISFLKTGSYNPSCVAGQTPTEWYLGRNDCNSGPFATSQMSKCPGLLDKIFCTAAKKPTYFRNSANQIENILIDNIDPFFNRVKLVLKGIVISSGYLDPVKVPNCTPAGATACAKDSTMMVPPAA
ncbi:hypothetical protein ABPG75_009533 [Micractinium tetrahymenae]